MDVFRSTAPVPPSSNGTSIAPGQIWRLSPEFYRNLNRYQQEVRATTKQSSTQNRYWQSIDLPDFVMIVREPDHGSNEVTVLPLSSRTEFVSDYDLVVPKAISELDRDVLAETWHTFLIPVSYLSERVGIRFDQATYNLMMDVGDSYYELTKMQPELQTIEAAGLISQRNLTHQQQHQIERFREQEQCWSDLLKISIDEHENYLRSMSSISLALQVSAKSEPNLALHSVVHLKEAPCLRGRFVRNPELKTLQDWVFKEHCKVVTISGNGGIGKSVLAAKFAEEAENRFKYVIWQSLRNAPKIQEIVRDIIGILSDGRESSRSLNDSNRDSTEELIHYLQQNSCLVILDNFDSVPINDPNASKHYRGYCQLLDQIQSSTHESCVILTSRSNPPDVVERSQLARSLSLKELKPIAGVQILKSEGLEGTKHELTELNGLYHGNPLALKIAASIIKENFDNAVGRFLAQAEQGGEFQDIQDSLQRQFDQLCGLAQSVMYWLAINRQWVTIEQLRDDIANLTPTEDLLEVIGFLEQRSLIERSNDQFTLQPVIMEWVTELFIDRAVAEFQDTSQSPTLLNHHALVKAQSKDYIQQNQRQQILQPLYHQLRTIYVSDEQFNDRCVQVLSALQEAPSVRPGYLAANTIALLRQFKSDLNHYNFSGLAIWQADFQGVDLNETNLSFSELSNSVFTKTLSSILTIAFHPDGQRLATGDKDGNLRIWQVPDGELLLREKHPGGWLRSVCFSPDGKLLASAGDGRTVRLWSLETGRCLKVLRAHSDAIRSVAFSHDSRRLISGGEDKIIHLWDVESRKPINTLEEHLKRIRAVAFSPDDRMIASASDDQCIRLWNSSGEYIKTLAGHEDRVFTIAFSPDRQHLASAGGDGTVRIWNLDQGTHRTIQAHDRTVRTISFSPDGTILVSGSEDTTLKIWSMATLQELKKLDQTHTSWVRTIAFNSAGMLASGGSDHRIKLWSLQEGQCIRTFQGYARRIWSIAVHPEGELMASAGEDHKIRLWRVRTGKCELELKGHTGWVRSVHFSPDGKLLASGAHDQTVRLWEVSTGTCIRKLPGHQHRVRAVCFSPDGKVLATGGHDKEIRLWDVQTGQPLKVLTGHEGCIRSLSFSPDGRTLISGSPDQTIRVWDVESGNCRESIAAGCPLSAVRFDPSGTRFASAGADKLIRLWELETGRCIATLQGHRRWVQSIAFDLTGDYLVSGSEDFTVRVWDLTTGKQIKQRALHQNWIRSVAFSPDGSLVMSGAEDETVQTWDWQTDTILDECRNPKPYQQTIITGVIGLSDEERSALQLLGAIDAGG
ncbi:NB-ARC domain-containing protein [Leptolyngbya sp. AN03gr2]|uniref:WD40 domain-containing protein n=1 Tax=unclassified Leptolyngbya TaxID=2650499 RepID=UPI003D318267